MPAKITKRTASFREIEVLVSKGYSANKIQRELQKENLGFRRQKLLLEIRLMKNQEHKLTPEKRQEWKERYTPKKYRKPEAGKIGIREKDKIYRMNIVISDVPVHSTPLNRNYLGFRLTAFSYSSADLNSQYLQLKQILIRLTSEYLGYDILDWENYDCYVGKESPVMMNVSNAHSLNGTWLFKVERNGNGVYENNGTF